VLIKEKDIPRIKTIDLAASELKVSPCDIQHTAKTKGETNELQ